MEISERSEFCIPFAIIPPCLRLFVYSGENYPVAPYATFFRNGFNIQSQWSYEKNF